MQFSICKFCLAIGLIYLNEVAGFEPLTIGAAVGLGALGASYLKGYTYCRYYECCDEQSIPGDVYALERHLKSSLYGQHIVEQHLGAALRAHFNKHSTSRKPLVISFQGTPGTGKNFVSDKIAQALYKQGLESKYVHKFMGRADFPQSELTSVYKERITRKVRESIKSCPRSLFIFDEVDKMPGGVFDALTSLVDYNTHLDGYDNTKAIFIFLSNTAGVHIAETLGNFIQSGNLREQSKLTDFETLLQKAAYNMDGGLKRTSLIESHVIDHYLPFLPLEKSHVVECIKAEYRRWGRNPNQDVINEITAALVYERQFGLFATSGCKTLEKKVAVAVMSP